MFVIRDVATSMFSMFSSSSANNDTKCSLKSEAEGYCLSYYLLHHLSS